MAHRSRRRAPESERAFRGSKITNAQWLVDNDQAIADYNAFVRKHGVFGDDWRQF